jgi:osmoprotectant transport system permease protein
MLAMDHELPTDVIPGSTMRGIRGVPFRIVFTTPIVLMLGIGVLYLWVQTQQLDSVERRTLTGYNISTALGQHLMLVGVSTAFVILIAVPLGILLTRPSARRIAPTAMAIVVAAQSIPSFGLLVIFAITLGLGPQYAIFALIISALLPVLSNTIVGLERIDGELKEAASGIGLTRGQVLRRVELPLAVPVILAGLRTAVVWNVGTATVAAVTGAGGLGSIIMVGLIQNRSNVTLVGGVLTAVLALALDHIFRLLQDFLTPRGL